MRPFAKMINPWALMQAGQAVRKDSVVRAPALNMTATPLGAFPTPAKTTGPGVGQGKAYNESTEKEQQRKRDLMTPSYSFSQTGSGRNGQ